METAKNVNLLNFPFLKYSVCIKYWLLIQEITEKIK